MQASAPPPPLDRGFTLVEMALVILIMVALASTGLFFNNKIKDWQLGRNASEALRSVYSAQRGYLADNPTASLSSLTEEKLKPYLPSGLTAIPTVTSLTGETLTIDIKVSPPKVKNPGAGAGYYDPSSNTTDLLWDTGP